MKPLVRASTGWDAAIRTCKDKADILPGSPSSLVAPSAGAAVSSATSVHGEDSPAEIFAGARGVVAVGCLAALTGLRPRLSPAVHPLLLFLFLPSERSGSDCPATHSPAVAARGGLGGAFPPSLPPSPARLLVNAV